MPLIKSGSREAISRNISEMIHAGHPRKQAIAAALSTARRYGKADGGEVEPDPFESAPHTSEGIPQITVRPQQAVTPPNIAEPISLGLGSLAKSVVGHYKEYLDPFKKNEEGQYYADLPLSPTPEGKIPEAQESPYMLGTLGGLDIGSNIIGGPEIAAAKALKLGVAGVGALRRTVGEAAPLRMMQLNRTHSVDQLLQAIISHGLGPTETPTTVLTPRQSSRITNLLDRKHPEDIAKYIADNGGLHEISPWLSQANLDNVKRHLSSIHFARAQELSNLEFVLSNRATGSAESTAPQFVDPREAMGWLRDQFGTDPRTMWSYGDPYEYVSLANSLARESRMTGLSPQQIQRNNFEKILAAMHGSEEPVDTSLAEQTQRPLTQNDWEAAQAEYERSIEARKRHEQNLASGKTDYSGEPTRQLPQLPNFITPTTQWTRDYHGILPRSGVSQNSAIFIGHDILPHYNGDFKNFVDHFFAGNYAPERFEVNALTNGVHIEGYLNNGGRVERSIHLDENGHGWADHHVFRLPPNIQGSGFGKEIIGNQVDLYRKMGLDHVSLFANIDVGSYAWAKYGFLPSESEWDSFRWVIGHSLGELSRRGGIPGKDKDALAAILDERNPRAIWALSDYPEKIPIGMHDSTAQRQLKWSQHLMVRRGWSGRLNLKDAQSMERFDEYVKKGR